MWMTGICRHCGTVIAIQSTQSQIRLVGAGRADGYYCPVCFGGRVERLHPCRTESLDMQYDKMRTQYILNSIGKGAKNDKHDKTSQIKAFFDEKCGGTQYSPESTANSITKQHESEGD